MNIKNFITNYLEGNEYEAFHFLGGHLLFGGRAVFRTYAPNAMRVSLIAECSSWHEIPMKESNGIYVCEVSHAWEGMMYKYRIYDRNGHSVDHCDPYGFYMEMRPKSASRLWKIPTSRYNLKSRFYHRTDITHEALNIYEIHPGSFMRQGRHFISYDELSKELIPYVKKQGFNAIEFLPLQEHPLDGSWGYQGTGLFAPTSRYGNPKQFKNFVNRCHRNGIKVIMDFVAVHFAVDEYALRNYDGTRLFEHEQLGPWGSCMYNHDSGMVRSFLKSAAWYWVKVFNVDGIRFDAVSNLIYWHGDASKWYFGGVHFLQEINQGLKKREPQLLLIAEDSTNYEGTTKPVSEGGLGFDYCWAMGWRYDILNFMEKSPWDRTNLYNKLTYSMDYYYQSKYILTLSHDETGGSEGLSIIGRMYGENEKIKYANARLFFLYMYCHPGKKLIFMGNEMGLSARWDSHRTINWRNLKNRKYQLFRRFIRDLNHIYLGHAALYASDYHPSGFWWIEKNRPQDGVVACGRNGWICEDAKNDNWRHEQILAFFNFSDQWRSISYDCQDQSFELILDSNWKIYHPGGDNHEEKSILSGYQELWLPPYTGRLYLKR